MPDNSIPAGFSLEASPSSADNLARFGPIADQAADAAGVPRELFRWQIQHESGWNPVAVNPQAVKGEHASGIAQFLPSTAKQFNADPFDPEQSLHASAQYMRQLYDQTGDWFHALKRYGTVSDHSPEAVKQDAARVITPAAVPPGFEPEPPVRAIPPGFTPEPREPDPMLGLAPNPRLTMETAVSPTEFFNRSQKFAERGIQNFGHFAHGLANAGNVQEEGALLGQAPDEQTREQGVSEAVHAGPLLPVSEFAPNPGFIHGSLQSAEGFTSPANLAIIGATMGAGSAAKALSGYALAAARSLQTALGVYFTDQMAQGTGAAVDRAIAAYKKHDLEGVKENLGFGSVQALMAAFGIYHAASGAQGVLSTEVPKLPATPSNRWSVGHSGGFEPGKTPEIAKDLPVSGPPAAPEPGPGPTIDVQAEPPAEAATPADVPPGVPPQIPHFPHVEPHVESTIPIGFQVESQPEAAPPLSTQLPAEAETGKANENKSAVPRQEPGSDIDKAAEHPDWFKPGLPSEGEPIRKEGDQTTVSVVRWQRTPGTPEVNPQGATFFSIANQAGQSSDSTYAGATPAAIHWGGEHQVAGDISFSNPLELPTEKQGKYNLPLPEQIIRTLAGPAAADFDRHYSMETQFQKFGVARGRGFLDQEAELEARLGIPPGTIADARQGPPGQIANSVAIALLRRDGYDGAIGKPAAPTDLAEAVRLSPLAPQAQDDALPKAAHQAPAVAEPTTTSSSPAEPPDEKLKQQILDLHRRAGDAHQRIGELLVRKLSKHPGDGLDKQIAELQQQAEQLTAQAHALKRKNELNELSPAPAVTYFSGSHNEALASAATRRGDIGLMVTPLKPDLLGKASQYPAIAIDNGVFSKKKPFDPAGFTKLIEKAAADPAIKSKVRFVVAPDVVGDAAGTLALFPEWADKIHALGLPVAFAAQNGIEFLPDQIPWAKMDTLFIGGDTAWKTGAHLPRDGGAAAQAWYDLFRQATARGIPVHMGRVNSATRLDTAEQGLGASSVDGNYIAFAPRANQPKLEQWLDRQNQLGRQTDIEREEAPDDGRPVEPEEETPAPSNKIDASPDEQSRTHYVEPSRFSYDSGDIQNSYSADKISDRKSTIRKPFTFNGQKWVTIASGGGGPHVAYQVVPLSEFKGKATTYAQQSARRMDRFGRNEPEEKPTPEEERLGGYHGMVVSSGKKDFVLVGPEHYFTVSGPERRGQPDHTLEDAKAIREKYNQQVREQKAAEKAPAKKPQGLPFAAAEAVKELKGIWENAVKFGEQGAQHQIRVYSDKSPAAVEEARQNGIEHGLSFSRDREAGLIEKLNQFRELARSKGLDPEEYLKDAGLPERWLKFAEKTGYSRERPETLLNDEALQRRISDPLLPRAKREAGEDAIRLAHQIEQSMEKGSPAAQVEAQRQILRDHLQNIEAAEKTPAKEVGVSTTVDSSRERPVAYGHAVEIAVPGEPKRYQARYALREAADVEPSHNPQSFEPNANYEHRNDRDYSRAINGARPVEYSSPGTFDTGYVVKESHTAEHGHTVTDSRRNALGGNARLLTQQRVYARGGADADKLKAETIRAATTYGGISPDEAAKFEHPLLTRELEGDLSRSEAQNAITDFNKTGAASLTPAEQSLSDSRRVSADTLDYLSFQIAEQGEDGTLAQVLSGSKGPAIIERLIADGVITANQRGKYITDKGVTAEGKQRITQLMVGRLFDSPAEFDATAPELRNKLEKIVGPLARVEVNPEWSLTEQTREAVAILNDARQHGIKNLDDLERQDTIFDKDLSDDPLAIARLIHAGQVKAAAAFRQYAADFEVFQRAQEGHAFDFLTPPTPREAFESAFLETPPAEPMLSRELVRVAPDRGKTYTPDELYRDVDAEPLPPTATRPARLRVNWQAGRFIAIAMRSGHFSGALIPAGHMNFVAHRVHDYAKQLWAGEAIELETFQQLENLADSLFEVAKLAQGNPAIIYRSDFGDYPIPGMPVAGVMGALRMRAETMREELTHQQQHVFARGENSTAHLTLAMRDYVMKDPAWPQIYKMLHDPGQGYEQFSHEQIILEAAAKIAAGRAESELNLTPRDAIRWLKRYEQGLIETHGLVPASEVFRFADPGIKSKLELAHAEDPHARERGDRAPESGSRNGRNQDGETGPAAEPGAPTRKSRATDEAAQRRGRARDDEGLRSLGGEDLSLFGDAETQDIAETAARDRDQLQGQRLTAQFKAPLTREEQLKKLKRTKEDPAAGPQSDFFEAPPDKPQGSLFSKSKDDEGVTLGAGLGAIHPYLQRFLKGDIVPTLKGIAELARLYKGDLLKLLAPAAVEGAEPMALSVRHRAAELARATDVAHATLNAALRYFDSRPPAENLEFYDRVETGANEPDANLKSIRDILRAMLDSRVQAIRALGTGKMQKVIENYLPHLYKDPKSAQQVFENAGKRPLEGSKSFLKKRTIATLKEAMAAPYNLEPFSTNPVELVLAKVREMDKYLAAHRIFADAKERGQLVAVDARDGQAPFGWKQIDDPMATIYGPSIQQINEYPNEGLHTGLDTVANALGLKQERGFLNLRGAIGRANQRTATVKTLHGTAEDVLAHEIGHQIDWLAGSGKRFVEQYPDAASAARLKRAYKTLKPGSGSTLADRQAARKELKDLAPQIQQRKAFAKELRDLADLRGGRKEYIRKREEKMAQLAQMWVGAREQFERTAPTVFKEWKRFLDDNPKLHALRDIEGSAEVKGLSQPYDVGGLVIRARWWAPEAAARILNNYLSPGLRDKSAIVRSFLSVSNFMNQAQLGFSGFHAAFTLTEAATSHLALAIYQGVNGILDGDALSVAKSFKTAALAPAAPFTSLMRGHLMLKEWNRPGSQGALIGQLADAAVTAGGRAKQESFYQTHIGERMMKAWREGNVFGAAWRAPFAAFEIPTRIIMEGLVPRLKMGAFASMAEHELARLGPNAAPMDVERALAKVWDSVDNRFGQLVYDDLFWHKYTKDLAMMLVRSPGWNVGDIRELGGGYGDSAKFATLTMKKVAGKGGRPEFTHRMAYIPAHLIVALTLGGLLYYVWHKKAPERLVDWFFPTDEHGQRWSLPTYVKDEFHWATAPVDTAAAKLNPVVPLAKAIATGKDYFGRKIAHAHHYPAELKQWAEYVLTQYEPLWMQQNHHALHRQTTADKILPELGITHAPKALDKHSGGGSVHLHR